MSEISTAYDGLPVLVLGGTGFIGRWVARALSQSNARVVLVVRNEALASQVMLAYGIRAEVRVADIENEWPLLESFIAEIQPAAVFNLAGYGVDRSERDSQTAYAINAELPLRLCEWLCEWSSEWRGCSLIHAGSALEYGELDNDLNEQSVPRPTTLYGESKLAGTEHVSHHHRMSGLRAVTARLFTVYGCGEHEGRLLPSLINAAKSDGELALTAGLQRRDFCFVEDVAEGLLRLGAVPDVDEAVVNLATGQLHSVREFAETAASELRIEASRLRFGALPSRAEEMSHRPVAVSRLRRLTHWMPPGDIREGIRRSLAYQQAIED